MDLLGRIVDERGMARDPDHARSRPRGRLLRRRRTSCTPGRIVESGAGRRRCFATPVHPYSEALLESICALDARRRPADRRRSPASRRCLAICRPAARSTRAARTRSDVCARGHAADCSSGAGAWSGATPLEERPRDRTDESTRPRAARRRPLAASTSCSRQFAAAVDVAPARGRACRRRRVARRSRAGETLGLVGESGSGKSTLARLLLRLDEPTAGPGRSSTDTDVLAAGARELRPLRRDDADRLPGPVRVAEPAQTVEQIVAVPLIVHGRGSRGARAPRARRRAARARRAPAGARRTLSARALRRPVPAGRHRARAGARPELRRARRGRLRARRVDPGADPQPAARPAGAARADATSSSRTTSRSSATCRDTIAVMYLGRIVELAPRARCSTRPRHPYTHALLSSIPPAPGAAARAPVVLSEAPTSDTLPLRLPLPSALPARHTGRSAKPPTRPLQAIGRGHMSRATSRSLQRACSPRQGQQ